MKGGNCLWKWPRGRNKSREGTRRALWIDVLSGASGRSPECCFLKIRYYVQSGVFQKKMGNLVTRVFLRPKAKSWRGNSSCYLWMPSPTLQGMVEQWAPPWAGLKGIAWELGKEAGTFKKWVESNVRQLPQQHCTGSGLWCASLFIWNVLLDTCSAFSSLALDKVQNMNIKPQAKPNRANKAVAKCHFSHCLRRLFLS